MATIGRKKKTKSEKEYIRSVKKPKKHRQVELVTGKRFQQFLKNYDEAVARGDLKPIKEIEELRKKWAGAWNKDGSVKKSAFKSNKKRKEFNADIRAFNKKYRKWGKQFYVRQRKPSFQRG